MDVTVHLSRTDREEILRIVSHLVQKKHFNPGLNGVDWHAVLESRKSRILERESPEEFEKELHELFSQLKTSHTGFFHQSARRIPACFAIDAAFQRCQARHGESRN